VKYLFHWGGAPFLLFLFSGIHSLGTTCPFSQPFPLFGTSFFALLLYQPDNFLPFFFFSAESIPQVWGSLTLSLFGFSDLLSSLFPPPCCCTLFFFFVATSQAFFESNPSFSDFPSGFPLLVQTFFLTSFLRPLFFSISPPSRNTPPPGWN